MLRFTQKISKPVKGSTAYEFVRLVLGISLPGFFIFDLLSYKDFSLDKVKEDIVRISPSVVFSGLGMD